MKRSVTIVNSSSWENQDYIVCRGDSRAKLRPGESVQFTPTDGEHIGLVVHAPEKASRFIIGGQQLIPKVSVEFSSAQDAVVPVNYPVKHLEQGSWEQP